MARNELARELRERLERARDDLRRIGTLRTEAPVEPAWWRDAHDGGDCWWMTGTAASDRRGDPRDDAFRDGAEALVLLTALAQIDSRECVDAIRDVWPPRGTSSSNKIESPASMCAIGVAFVIATIDDLAPISERMCGVRLPTDAFTDYYPCLQTQLATLGEAISTRPIPIRLHVRVTSDNPEELGYVLCQIVQNAIAQRALAQCLTNGLASQIATSTRFELVEMALDADDWPTVDSDALEYLVRLVDLGVRIRELPPLAGDYYSAYGYSCVAKSLHVLVPASSNEHEARSCIEHVKATDDMTTRIASALFSSICVNRTVSSVELKVQRDPFRYGQESVRDVISLWEWAAYALFSRHADHNVQCVTLHVDYLVSQMVLAVEQVLRAANPLAQASEISIERDEWVESSRFRVLHYGELSDGNEFDELRTQHPMRARVMERQEYDGQQWCCVFLPGCGEAWVENPKVVDVDFHTRGHVMDLTLDGMSSDRQEETLKLLGVVGHTVNSLEVAMGDRVDFRFDMTDWMREALVACPRLERLKLPKLAQIKQLQCLVDAAEAGQLRLKTLSLGHTLCSDSSDIIQFLDVLSDTQHSLTQHLEELHVAVSSPVVPTNNFQVSWQRMLDCNRTLHTISISFEAIERLPAQGKQVAIRNGPLQMKSKLAFLSSVNDAVNRKGDVYERLDAGIVSIVFAFAAEHRLRVVTIKNGN